jgi:hypothetical protein
LCAGQWCHLPPARNRLDAGPCVPIVPRWPLALAVRCPALPGLGRLPHPVSASSLTLTLTHLLSSGPFPLLSLSSPRPSILSPSASPFLTITLPHFFRLLSLFCCLSGLAVHSFTASIPLLRLALFAFSPNPRSFPLTLTLCACLPGFFLDGSLSRLIFFLFCQFSRSRLNSPTTASISCKLPWSAFSFHPRTRSPGTAPSSPRLVTSRDTVISYLWDEAPGRFSPDYSHLSSFAPEASSIKRDTI